MSDKVYLGDSVYCRTDGEGSLVLTTENGVPGDPSNVIVVDETVWRELVRFVDSARREGRLS